MINEQILLDVQKLVDLLPESQQSVVQMRFFEQINFNEIAKKGNISVNTALERMRYALINMRRIVVKKEIDLKLRSVSKKNEKFIMDLLTKKKV